MFRIYLRCSTQDQTTDSQEGALNAFAIGKDCKWYRDSKSGTTMNRPAWKRLESDLKAGDTVVCYGIDRLGRTVAGLSSFFESCHSRGINLVSIREGINLETIAGRMIANVLASLAQWETEMRSERCKAGIEAAKAKGKYRQGGKQGLRKVKPEQLQAIRTMKAEGKSVSSIARATGLTRKTVYRLLDWNGTGAIVKAA